MNEKKTCLGAMTRQMTQKSHEFCLVFSFVNFFFLRFFLNVGHFLKSLLNFCYNIASVLCFGHKSPGILGLQPGTALSAPKLSGEVLTTGPPGRSLLILF